MRKKSVIAILIIAMLAVSMSLVACNRKKGGGETPQEDPLVWTIADFETAKDFDTMRIDQYFGAVYVNTDARFVKSGSRSARLRPLGGARTGTMPIVFFPLKSELYDYDKTDVSAVKEITYEIYNNGQEPVNVAVGFIITASPSRHTKTPIEYQAVAPGQWTTVTYKVDTSVLSLDNEVMNFFGVYIAFENARSRDEADAPDIYVDDIIMYSYETAPEIRNLIELEENEYLDFESDWQKYVIGTRSTDSAPISSIVKASDCKIGPEPASGQNDTRQALTAPHGENVLRVIAPVGENKASYYPGVRFSKRILKESLFGQLTENDYGNVTFSCWIFNNSPYTQRFGIKFANEAGKEVYEQNIYPEPYEWTEYRITLMDLYEKLYAKYGGNSLFENPGAIEIIWDEFNEGGDREYFVDYMHFEVDEKDPDAAPILTAVPFPRTVLVGSYVGFPTVTATDKYDTSVSVVIDAYFKKNGDWKLVTLSKGRVPVNEPGEYKFVAKATNSLGNTTEMDFPFLGVTSMENNVWVDFSYADEVSALFMDSFSDSNNSTEWYDEITIGGETRHGVAVAKTNNGQYNSAAGYLGFRFASELLSAAADASWDYFTIEMYVEAPISTLNLRSVSTTIATDLPTGEWVQLVITKEMLNGTKKSAVNGTGVPMSDKAFYNSFAQVFGDKSSRLFYTTSLSNKDADCHVSYYIDKITWGVSGNDYGDGDDVVQDEYPDDWEDPDKWVDPDKRNR